MWAKVSEAWQEIVKFLDRIIGWVYYVLGEDENPYVYDDFHTNVYD